MKDGLNGWMVAVLIVVLVLLGKGFAWYETKNLIPATVAQIGSNQQLVTQVNEAFGTFEPRVAAIETRLDALERRGKSVE